MNKNGWLFRNIFRGAICFCICCFNSLFFIQAIAQSPFPEQIALQHFRLLSSEIAGTNGAELSDPDFVPRNYWFPAVVPGTVLTTLVHQGIYPDPHIGMNNMFIPDANDSFNIQYGLSKYSYLPHVANPWKKPYWYRTEFKVPAQRESQHVQLIFKGINYRAAVWLNGHLIADSSQMVGMFAEYAFDVTHWIHVGGNNALAIEIFPLDDPGMPSPPQLKALGDFYPNGGPTGDIGKNVTMLCSVGWDWIPEVHDRNIGIWQPVYLRFTGPAVIEHPQVITDLPHLPDTTTASIRLQVRLCNFQRRSFQGKLVVNLAPQGFPGKPVEISKLVTLSPTQALQIEFNPDAYPTLIWKNPHLWWPNGYGIPNLYRIRLQLINREGMVSDDTSFLFGIRTVSSRVTMVDGWPRRDFYVNGQRIAITGGAWVPDMMLQEDSLRFDRSLRLCRDAHLNLIRIWGGGVAPPDVFFEIADRYGLLVWQDFWITGDTQGEFKGSPNWPLLGDVFIRNVVSTILRLRNHPSLLVWTGGNEGHARKSLYLAMRNAVAQLDGTRPFIPSSSGFARLPEGWLASWPDNEPAGVYSGGPYTWQKPQHYFALADRGHDWVFKDETGIPSQPPYASLPKIIPDLVPDSSLPFPLNNTWGYHDACTGNGHYEQYYWQMVERYGSPSHIQDFSQKMQLMNAEAYRAIFESVAHLLNDRGGVMLWKLNAAFPSVIWQIFDWYLMPNAGYYFIQSACAPLHIQFNADDSTISIVNRSYQSHVLQAQINWFDSTGKRIYTQTLKKLMLTPSSVKQIASFQSRLCSYPGISFLQLSLQDVQGKLLDENTYWLSARGKYHGFKTLAPTSLQSTLLSKTEEHGRTYLRFRIQNTGNSLAFFIHAQIIDDQNGQEILPAYWSANYFSLAPGESRIVTVNFDAPALRGVHRLQLLLKAWNTQPQQIGMSLSEK
ncbi:MAG: hypothetical protein K6T34_04085 [Thermoflavifilum sp.]|nr:hypothetical protein [Thermoflavifilum sp.]